MTGSRPAAAQDSLEELVRRAASGDVAAFARIVRLHNEGMTRVAFVIAGDTDAAVGVTDAAWLSAWTGLRRKRTREPLGPWLCSVVAAEAIEVARRRGTRRDTVPAPGPHPADPAAGDGQMSALARLEPEDRALLALRHVAGLSMAELTRSGQRFRPPVEHRLARLADEICGPLPSGSDPTDSDRLLGLRLRAYAHVPVRQVDADATARRARAEASLERTRVVSVAIATVVGVLVAVHPYLARLFFGR